MNKIVFLIVSLALFGASSSFAMDSKSNGELIWCAEAHKIEVNLKELVIEGIHNKSTGGLAGVNIARSHPNFEKLSVRSLEAVNNGENFCYILNRQTNQKDLIFGLFKITKVLSH